MQTSSSTWSSAAQPDADVYMDVQDVWLDVKSILGDMDPVHWLHSVERGAKDNYFDSCRRVFEEMVDWGGSFPNAALNNTGCMVCVPITVAAYQEEVQFGGESMTTCWKAISKCRCMPVLERIFLGGRGLDTSMELPMLVMHPELSGHTFGNLLFQCAHGTCTTRIMAAHVAMRALLHLEQNSVKNPFELPAVQCIVLSLARMNCFCRVLTAAERTVVALGGPAESQLLQSFSLRYLCVHMCCST